MKKGGNGSGGKPSPQVRLDATLASEIEKERQRRSKVAGVELSLSAVVNAMLREQIAARRSAS